MQKKTGKIMIKYACLKQQSNTYIMVPKYFTKSSTFLLNIVINIFFE